jgi:hypothetical protein
MMSACLQGLRAALETATPEFIMGNARAFAKGVCTGTATLALDARTVITNLRSHGENGGTRASSMPLVFRHVELSRHFDSELWGGQFWPPTSFAKLVEPSENAAAAQPRNCIVRATKTSGAA